MSPSFDLVVASGNNSLFPYLHVAFIVALACLLLVRGFLNGIWRPAVQHWSRTLLALFLCYFFAMATLHPDAEVAQEYTRTFFTSLMPGLLMGYVAFAAYGSRNATVLVPGKRWRPGYLRALLDLVAFFTYGAVIAGSYSLLLPFLRQDIFLLDVPQEQRIYQVFGNYTALALILGLHVISPYFQLRYGRSITGACVWAAIVSVATGASVLLGQMVGSNTGPAVVAIVGTALLGHRAVSELRMGTKRARRRGYALLLVAGVSAICFWQILGYLPPLRLFNFQEVTTPS